MKQPFSGPNATAGWVGVVPDQSCPETVGETPGVHQASCSSTVVSFRDALRGATIGTTVVRYELRPVAPAANCEIAEIAPEADPVGQTASVSTAETAAELRCVHLDSYWTTAALHSVAALDVLVEADASPDRIFSKVAARPG